MTKFTRKDLLNEECSHHEFYAQFVTERTLSFVRDRIGLVKLRKSSCPHFNDVGIKHSSGGAGSWVWDYSPVNMPLLQELGVVSTGYRPNPSTYTCIGKAAARMLLAQEGVTL